MVRQRVALIISDKLGEKYPYNRIYVWASINAKHGFHLFFNWPKKQWSDSYAYRYDPPSPKEYLKGFIKRYASPYYDRYTMYFDDDVKDVSRQIRLAFGIKKGYKQRKLPHFQFKILNENTEKIRYELISRAL